MKIFIIATIFMSLTVGLFFGLILTLSLGGIKRFIASMLIALTIGSAISTLLTLQAKGDNERWNEGVCPTCGESWRLVNVEHLRHGSIISYYVCDNCQRVIEIHGSPY